MKTLCIFGTTSNAGKSTLTMALGKLLKDAGFTTMPYKAQNMSNNAAVADDGSEIARAQALQAEVLDIKTSWKQNPILLKPLGDRRSQLVLRGQDGGIYTAQEYYESLDWIRDAVDESLESFKQECDVLIAEGAGSPVELNLMNKDLANIYVALRTGGKIILIADIENGGVFAQIHGTLDLLPAALRQNVIGVVINKFRGDQSLFEEGVKIIEEQFKVPVLGVVPHMSLPICFEDSQNIEKYCASKRNPLIRAAMIRFPKIANYDDFDPFVLDPQVEMELIDYDTNLEGFDCILLPGSRSVISDLRWLKDIGLYKRIWECDTPVFGICGGYQMLFESIEDPDSVETPNPDFEPGFGFIRDKIVYKPEKKLKKEVYTYEDHPIPGYEMHHGFSYKFPLFFKEGRIHGSHVHGVFAGDSYRNAFLSGLNKDYKPYLYAERRHEVLSRVIQAFSTHLDMERIINELRG